MGDQMKHARERLENEFRQISSNDTWTKDSIEMMKNTLKSMYYIDVICAMKESGKDDYSGYSYATRPSHRYYDYDYDRNYDRSYDRGYSRGGSGRRYYDDEKDHAKMKLHQMMDNEQNEEVRMAIRSAIAELER